MKRIYRTPARTGGFSLIEVMIAVVVLATGLLALAALQASLARSSSDAKIRSRVAALLTAHMDELRATQYSNAATLANDGCTVDLGANDWVPVSFCTEAGLGAVTTTQTVVTWSSPVGAASFTQGRVPAAGEPQFKRVTLGATWTDASNASHRLSMASEMSALALSGSLLPPPPGGGASSGGPTVRTINPAGPGVIPIATGGGDATAATNPRPIVIGKNNNQSTVGTQFDVVTYSGLSGPAVIQRRFETTAIKCDCKYGAGGTSFSNLPEIYRAAQWPAVWTGERYDVYKPNPVIDAPGQAYWTGQEPNAAQSPLCQECCRDHHDTTTAGVAKFDPVRVIVAGQAHEHYVSNNQNLLDKVNNTNTSSYEESCRLIRVDGFWRTAADLYSRQMGLLATESVSKPGATGVPTTTAVAAYQTFVKDYLAQYTGAVANAPAGAYADADAMFNVTARGLNDPASISIARPSPKDERYLHGRGLYVDYLEKDARDKIVAVRAKCTAADKTECMLPYLPFTTINVTELAFWAPEKEDKSDGQSILSVASGGSLIYDPLQPTRGRTNATATATNAAPAFSMAKMGGSNSGVAIFSGIDPDDEIVLTDRQKFVVTAPVAPGVGDKFSVILGGTDLVQISDTNTSNDPSVAWATTAPADAGNCVATIKSSNPGKDLNPNNYVCSTSAALGILGSVTVSNYFRAYDSAPKAPPSGTTCTGSSGSVVVTGTVAFPQFDNFRVNTAKVGLTLPSAVAATTTVATNDGKRTESTTSTFASIPKDSFVWVDFAKQATIEATIQSCTATYQNSSKTWVIASVIWNKPWETP